MAPLARSDRVSVVLALDELTALLDPGDDGGVGLGLGQALEIAGLVVHPAVEPDHHRLGEPVVATDLEVQRIVAGRDLERARAERRLDTLVRDHRHAALDVRDDDLAADRTAVALVVRVHRDGDVAEDRGGPHRRDHDAVAPVTRRVRASQRTGSGRT